MLYIYNMSRAKDDLIWEALSNPTRRKILDLIRDEPKKTGDICKKFKDLDRCTVMLHLKVLEDASLVIPKKEGRFRWNYIDVVPIQRIQERWIQKVAMPSASLLSQLSKDLS